MNRYRKIFHHIDIKDVKDKHLEESIATKLKQEKRIEEEKYITAEAEKLKVDWRKELEEEELKESDWTPISSGRPTMSTAQTFQHASGATATFGGLGGSDVHPTQVTLTVSGDSFSVEAPTFNQLPLQGIPMPVSAAMPIHRRISEKKAEETNKQLDASEKVAEKAKADALMKARVAVTGDENPADIKDLNERAKLVKERIELVKKWKEEAEIIDKLHQPALDRWHAARDADAKERHAKVEKVVRDLGWKGTVNCWGTHEFQITGEYDPKKPSQKLIVIEKENKLFGLDSPYGGGVVVHTITPYRNPDTGLYSKITKTTFKTPRKIPSLGTSKYHSPTNDDGKSEFGWSGIGNISTSSEFSLKDFPEPVPPKAKYKLPKFYEKNRMMDWAQVSKESEDYLNKLKIPFSKSITGVKFAGQLALRLASGDLRPITKSPGFVYNNIVKGIVSRAVTNALAKNIIDSGGQKENYPSYYNPKTGIGQVQHDAYDTLPGNNKIGDAPVRGSIGRFTFRSKPDGLEIHDIFDITKVTSVGGLALGDLVTKSMGFGSVQTIANKLTAISMQRGAEAGFDMKDSEGKDIWSIFADDVDEKTSASHLHTPKGFNIDVTFTIPWGQVPSELRSQLGGKEVNKRGRTVKPHRLDAYGGVSKLHDKKKKKVSESKVFDKIKKDFSYKGKPSPDGFPDTPPPKLKNGWHPEYGKVDNRYNRLDPISARSMPKTGEASIDKKVEKAKKKKK